MAPPTTAAGPLEATAPLETAAATAAVKRREDAITKSANDDRSYRFLELANGLKVLLVHDAGADKASAALDVHVGSFCDPEELQGLAHFLEHMLFLGTEKYPRENDYNAYLSEHGGGANAFTSQEHTNYHLEVAPDHLYGALDRFAQFFIAPLFAADGTERELRAVDSENKKNLQADNWRLFQLEKHLSNPAHPYHKFSTGNLTTLWETPRAQGIDVRQALLDFHARYYSANLMSLVVVGREPLDQLEAWTVELFAAIPNKDVPLPTFPGHPLSPETLQTRVDVVPVRDLYQVELMWPFPALEARYRSKPHRYLAHLIGHEGKGSVLSLLKARGLANGLSAGTTRSHHDFDIFKVSVELTDAGARNVNEVVTIVLDYIRLLQAEGPMEWIFRECRDLADIAFRFKEKERSISYATNLAPTLHLYPPTELLTATKLFFEYIPADIVELLGLLRPDNFRLVFVSPTVATEAAGQLQHEPHYLTQYTLRPLTPDERTLFSNPPRYPELQLPGPNAFIPADLETLRPKPATPVDASKRGVPVRLLDTPGTTLWFKQDDVYFVPKSAVSVLLITPLAQASPVNAGLLNLFTEVVIDALNEFAYDAELAGLRFDVVAQPEGIQLAIDGYHDKLPVLLSKAVDTLLHAADTVAPSRFKDLLDRLLRSYRSWRKETAVRHVVSDVRAVLAEVHWTFDEKHDAIQGATLADLQAFAKALTGRGHLEVLVHGNYTAQFATDLARTLEAQVAAAPLQPSERRRQRTLKLPAGTAHVWEQEGMDPEGLNSAVELFYQVCQDEDERLRCLTELVVEAIHEAAFDQLRTKEQLGYIVQCGMRRNISSLGVRFIVQSEKSPAYLYRRLLAFVEAQGAVLKGMTEAEFQARVQSLVTRKRDKDKNLRQEANRHFGEILAGYYHFDRANADIAVLETLRHDELVVFYQRYLLDPATRAVLLVGRRCIKVPGEPWDGSQDGITFVTDVEDFRQSLEAYAVPRPVGHPARQARRTAA